MSQFNSLSKDFRESLIRMADSEAKKKDPVGAFFNGQVRDWYESLDAGSKSEVYRLFSELSQFSGQEIRSLMKQAKVNSPMGLVESMLASDDGADRVIEVKESDKSSTE